MADAPVETTRPTPSETLKPKDTRERVVTSFKKSVSAMETAPDLSPTERRQLEEAKEFAKNTFERAEDARDYDAIHFQYEDKRFRTHERVPVDGILRFLDRKIKEGGLPDEQKREYEELLSTLAKHSKPYERGKRNDPLQKVARVTHEAQDLQERGEISKHEDAYVAAADRLGGRLELVLPREIPRTAEEEILASGISVDEALDSIGERRPIEEPTAETPPSTESPADDAPVARGEYPDSPLPATSAEYPDGSGEYPPDITPKTPEELKREMLITNREDDFFKRAREVAEENVQGVLRGEGSGGRVRRFFKRIKYRVAEEYYRQKFTKQAYKAMVDSGNPYLQMTLVKNSLEVTGSTGSGTAQEAALGVTGRLKTGDVRSTEKVSDELTGPLRDELIATIVKPIFNGDISDQTQVQERLRAFVDTHKDDPLMQEFFGKETTIMGKVAENFATDLLEMGKGLKADFDTHGFSVDQLDKAVSLRMARAEWAAMEKRGVGKEDFSRTDRFIKWCQKRRLTGAIFNPVVIGAGSSLATFALLRLPGRALTTAGHIATPGVGMLTGGAFAALRRNYDLKVDRVSHNIERTYGGEIEAGSKRREKMERYRYDTVSAHDLIMGRSTGEHPMKSMEELGAQDLSIEENRRALLERLAEIEGRQEFSAIHKIDLITFSGRDTIEQERFALAQAKARARVRLKESGLSDHEIQEMRDKLITEAFKPRFEQDQGQKDKAFKVHRLKSAAGAGVFGAAAGLGVGFAAHEVTTEVLRSSGIGGGSYSREVFGEPRGKINPDTLTQLRERGGSINIDNDIRLKFDAETGKGSLFNLNTKQDIPAELTLKPNGNIHVKGELPPGIQDKLHDGGFDIDEGPKVDGTRTVHNIGENPDSTVGHETKIPKGTEWVQDPSDPTKWDLVEKGGSGKILVQDAQFDSAGRLIGYDQTTSKALVETSEVVTQKEVATGEFAAAELDKYGTSVHHREWYGYNTPYSERNELTAYNSIFDSANGQKGVVWNMSQMTLGYQNGLNPNPIDVQQVIANHEAGFAFSVPGHEGTPVWVSDGADGVWDGRVVLDPSDTAHRINPMDPNSITVAEFSQKILNQGALSSAVAQNIAEGNDPSYLASELTQRQNVFNLGLNGKMGYIEAGRMIPGPDGRPTLQIFATGRGSTDVGFEVIKNVQTTFNLTQEVAIKIPTYELRPADYELFPIIPFPFAPRYPLEKMKQPAPLIIEYGEYGEYGEPGRGEYGEYIEDPRTGALAEAPKFVHLTPEERGAREKESTEKALIDERVQSQEKYIARLKEKYRIDSGDPSVRRMLYLLNGGTRGYVEELAAVDSTLPPMSEKTKLSVVIPAFNESGRIEETLRGWMGQREQGGEPMDPSNVEFIVLVNRPNATRVFDNTIEVIDRLRLDPAFSGAVIHTVEKTFNFPDEGATIPGPDGKPITISKGARMGLIYKFGADLAMMRNLARHDEVRKANHLMRTGGADAKEKSPEFLSRVFSWFDENPELDQYTSRSEYPAEVYERLPLLHVAQRLNQIMNLQLSQGRTHIGLGTYRMGTYAEAGGFDAQRVIGEEIDLSRRMRRVMAAHGHMRKRENIINAIDDPRRAVATILAGRPITQQYGNWADESVRSLDLDAALTTPLPEAAQLTAENVQKQAQEVFRFFFRQHVGKQKLTPETVQRAYKDVEQEMKLALRILGIDHYELGFKGDLATLTETDLRKLSQNLFIKVDDIESLQKLVDEYALSLSEPPEDSTPPTPSVPPAPVLPDTAEPEPTLTPPVPPVRPTPPTPPAPATAEEAVSTPPELVTDLKEGDRTVLGRIEYQLINNHDGRGNRLVKVDNTEIEDHTGQYEVFGKSTAAQDHPETDQDSIVGKADSGFIGVFDGVGGESAGDVASGIASKVAQEVLSKIPVNASRKEVRHAFNEVFTRTYSECAEYSREHPEAAKMGTTGTIAKIFEDEAKGRSIAIMHAGDTRLYLMQKDGTVKQLTADHSLIYRAVQNGSITKEEGERLEKELDEITSVTTNHVARDADPVWQRFLGRNEIVKSFNRDLPDLSLHQIQESDSLVFATSDGIHDNLTRTQIEEIARGAATKQVLTERLIEKAREVAAAKGGYDNVRGKNDDMSVVVMNIA